jgi:hypothetical protein
MPEVMDCGEGTDSLVLFHNTKTWWGRGTEIWLPIFFTYIEVNFTSW